MRNDTGSRAALAVIGNLVMQAAAQGDTAGMLEHLAVYIAVIKSSKRVRKSDGE